MDTLSTIIAIGLAAVLMFVFPLMTMADRTDDVVQTAVQAEIAKFADDVGKTGIISMEKYDKLLETISATGNSFEIEMEVKVLDENPGKKTTVAQTTKIGENVYYSMYTVQILDSIGSGKSLALKEGDIFSINAKNTNMTLSQQLKNFFYTVVGDDTYVLGGGQTVMVTQNGTRK